MRSFLSFIFTSMLMVILLNACCFQLRGNMPLAPPLHRLYLDSKDPYGQLSQYIREYLQMSNVCLTCSPCDAKTVLVILSEEMNQQLLSVSGTQQTRQYSLILTVAFQIRLPNGIELTPPQTVTETRTLTIESNQILAGSNEATSMYQQMRRAIVFDIMNRLSSQEIACLVMKRA